MGSRYRYSDILDNPYQGLVPYSEEDALFFFGRERWQQIITDNLMASRLTILYGASGVGKSSVLQAGVAHNLHQLARENLLEYGSPEFTVIVFKDWQAENPLTELMNQIESDIKKLFGERPIESVPQSSSLDKTLQLWTERLGEGAGVGKLLIILDQFEEYFLYHSHEDGAGTFAVEFPRAVNSPTLRVNFLLSMREDSISKINHFRRYIPNVIRNTLEIKHLDKESARDAIIKPIQEYNRQKIIFDLLTTERLTLLSGDHDVGKTTVLKAGVAYHLRQAAQHNLKRSGSPEFAVVVFNSWQGAPIANLINQIEVEIGGLLADWEITSIEKSQDIRQFLDLCTERIGREGLKGELFIILDQFEDYFRYHPDNKEEESFAAVLSRIVTCPNLSVNLLISISEDSLPELKQIKDFVPNLWDNHWHLNNPDDNSESLEALTPLAASEYLQPVNQKIVSIEDELVNAVLKQVGQASKSEQIRSLLPGSNISLDFEIEAPYLQLVMTRLWQKELDDNSSCLHLETLNQLGNVTQIVREHLNERMNSLETEEKELAATIFKNLVTPGGTKIAYPILHLAKLGNDLDAKAIDVLLEKLTSGSNRILRPVGASPIDPTEQKYEIFHNVLAQAILRWLDKYYQEQELQERIHLKEQELEQHRQEAKRQTKYRLQLASAILLTSFIVSAIVGGLANRALQATQLQRNVVELELESLETFRHFERYFQLEALLMAMHTAQRINKDQNLLEQAPIIKRVLQHILDNIQEQNQFIVAETAIWSISYSPDGKYLATGTKDGKPRLWNLEGHLLEEFSGHQDEVWSVSFSPDSQQLVTGAWDGTIRLWDLKGNLLREFPEHQDKVWSVSFSPNGQQLVSATEDGTIRLWDLEGNLKKKFPAHERRIFTVRFSPDSQYLVTGSEDGTARLWDLQGQQLQKFQGNLGSVYSVEFSSDGKYLVTGSEDGTARLWDLQGQQLQKFQGHRGHVYTVQFSSDDKHLITSSEDGTARLWNVQKGDQLKEFKGQRGAVWSAQFSPNEQQLVIGLTNGIAQLWNLGDTKLELKGHEGIIGGINFSPDGKYLATGSTDGTARLWDLEGNQLTIFKGHKRSVIKVIFSPDGKRLATSSGDGTARLWDLEGNQLTIFKGHKNWVWGVDFSPNEQKLVTGSSDGTVRLWDFKGNLLAIPIDIKTEIWSVSVSPNGKYLATGSGDGIPRIWDLEGNLVKEFPNLESWIPSVNFSPDGQQLITGSADGKARLWDLQGNLLQIFEASEGLGYGVVYNASFSPDGQQLITSSADGKVRLWDLKGKLLKIFDDDDSAVYSASFSPDRQRLIIVSADGTAELFPVADLEYDQLIDRGCDWLKDYLAIHPEAQKELKVCQRE